MGVLNIKWVMFRLVGFMFSWVASRAGESSIKQVVFSVPFKNLKWPTNSSGMRVAFPGAAEGVDMLEVLKGVKEDGSRRSIADACLTKVRLDERRWS